MDELTFVWNSMLCALAVMTLMSAYRKTLSILEGKCVDVGRRDSELSGPRTL